MNVVADGRMTGKDTRPHVDDDHARVPERRQKGLIRDMFIKADGTEPIRVLNDVTAAEADQRLAKPRLLAHHLPTFDYVERVGLSEVERR
jgi:hypothetical protein